MRSSTLRDGYGLEDIRAIIEGRTTPSGRAPDVPRKVNLVIDIQEKMKQGKGEGFKKWATVYNLKQMAAALQYLQENNLLAYDNLSVRAEAAAVRMHDISGKLQQTETDMKRNAELKKAIVDYSRTRPIFEEYKSKKYSNKYLAEHEDDISVYRTAQATMKELLNGEKLPKMNVLKDEWQTLKTAKKSGYAEYRAAQKDMRDMLKIKANIDHLFSVLEVEKKKEIER